MANDYEDVLRLLVTLLAAGIFLVALLSYRRRPTTRTLLVTVAFAVYVLKGLFLSGEVFIAEHGDFLESLGIVADAAFLILISLAFMKR